MDDADGAQFDHGGVGLSDSRQHVLHDRDTKFCSTFQETLKAAGVTPLKLPARSPEFECPCRALVRSVKEEGLSNSSCLGKAPSGKCSTSMPPIIIRNAIIKGNGWALDATANAGHSEGNLIRARERLGGLLKYYYREAA